MTPLKIALAQIDTTVGAIEENARRVVETARRAARSGARLVAFPELTLTGYPPQDLLERPSFVEASGKALVSLAADLATVGDIAVVVGHAAPSGAPVGKPVHNAAALLIGGRVTDVVHKGLLPTYDVFSEARYFEPGKTFRPIELDGRRIGLTICEDIWLHENGESRPRYAADPVASLAEQGIDLLLNISASPYSLGRPAQREELGRNIARRFEVPVALVNLVGGNDSLIFDGTSYVLDATGAVLGRASSFEEDLLVVDLDAPPPGAPPPAPAGEREMLRALELGLADYVRKTGFRTTLVGLSGGIDSSVVCSIAARALGPGQVAGVSMPGPYTSEASREDAATLARALGVRFHEIPIGGIFDAYRASLVGEHAGEPMDLAEENVQARIRGNILMALSNRFGHLVLSTGNKSEMAVGYCTLYGDMSGGLAVISDVPKTAVYRLAAEINRDGPVIPERVLTRAPTAELRPDQTDQDSLPPYEVLDPILEAYIEGQRGAEEIVAAGHDPDLVRRVIRMVERNEHKRRQAPIGLRVSVKAFGMGRLVPIARGTAGSGPTPGPEGEGNP